MENKMNLVCPSCRSENTQRLNVLLSQQSTTGLGGQTLLAADLRPPRKYGTFFLGFLVGLMVYIVATLWWEQQWLGLLLGILVWIGIWQVPKIGYQKKLGDWKEKMENYFLCLRCGKQFRPGAGVIGKTA